MLTRKWGQVVLSLVVLVTSARGAMAQDASRDSEIEALKRRLEVLESAKTEGGAIRVFEPVEEKWFDRVKVGGGVRTSFVSAEDQAPNGQGAGYDFNTNSARFYSGGKITETISATLNAEFTGTVSVLDAYVQFKFSDEFQLFAGRHLPATDRSNSDGPYYLIAWDFPETSIAFNNSTNGFGRDDGITFFGDVGKFKYWVGAYEGTDPGLGASDHLLYALRAQYDFFDAESGFYLSSTYHGSKKVLAAGFALNYQSDVAGQAVDAKSQTNLAIDLLWEDKLAFLSNSVATVEVAMYKYLRGGYGGDGLTTSGATGLGQGTGMMFTLALLLPYEVGCGKFQPLYRYQGFDERSIDVAKNPTKDNFARHDIGFNYVIKGHDARVSVIYSALRHGEAALPNNLLEYLFTIGLQGQF